MNHYTAILRSLTNESLVITPNRRLALSLHAQYQQSKLAEGLSCWETPLILPVNTWIEAVWSDYAVNTLASLPYILNAPQEQQLWEKILSDSPYQQFFLQVSETARLVKSARGLLKQWRVSPDHPLFNSADDYLALRQWIQQFEKTCEDQHWIDQASLPDLVRNQIEAGKITVPQQIYFAGFAELSPQLQALFSAAAERGSQLTHVSATEKTHALNRTSALNDDEEIRLCASWAKQQHDLQPPHLIGCVFPKLDQQRERVTQIFTEVFGSHEKFNISAGQPLSHYPVIHAALECLSLYKKQISSNALFFLLCTPFVTGGESERIKRSQFDSKLRAKNFNSIDLDAQLIRNEDSKTLNLARSCPKLANGIRAFKVLLEEHNVTSTFTHWAHVFNQALSALGWPGERILNSEEYQVVDEWLKLLQELMTLDSTTAPVNYHDALQVLMAMAAAKPFQPKTPSANIQILGVLEAAGLSFDQLWVTGMDDSNWPSQPKPNPFIPKQLQRELNMPHASAERELIYCQNMTHQFQCSAQRVTFSYARTQDDNFTQPSPLIRELPEIHDVVTESALSERIYQHREIVKIIDEQAPAQMESEQAKGGVRIIENQALCPFKAFAESRLGARELESPLPGLRGKERGTIVHQILERCWKHLQTQAGLLATSDEDLHALLEVSIDEALREHAHAQLQQKSYLALEKQRLLKLIFEWLQIEKLRSPFTVISSETSTEIQLDKLNINVRIDRIDELADGNKLIIDYKTGSKVSRSGWFGDRPEAPQLPLYAQIDSVQTAGITYAHVAAGKLSFLGISQYDLEIRGITPAADLPSSENKDWKTLADEWHVNLHQLADDFYHGKAEVDPKDPKKTCVHCNLKPLCRIYEYNGYLEDE